MVDESKSKLDWEFLEDENQESPWPPDSLPNRDAPELTKCQRLGRAALVAIAMAILLTTGIGTIYANNEAQKGIAVVEEGVQAVLDAEQWAQANDPELSASTTIDDGSPYVRWMVFHEQHLLAAIAKQDMPCTTQAMGDTRFAGSYAAAEIMLTPCDAEDGATPVYRQTRFYRETPEGWRRTAPVPALWGSLVSMETDHLVWHFRKRDEDTVKESARYVDALYAQSLADHGLKQNSGHEKPAVRISVGYEPGRVMSREQPAFLVSVPSPSIYLLPEKYSDADVLDQVAALAMLKRVGVQAADAYSSDTAGALLAGLQLWEMHQLGLGLSTSTWNALMKARGVEAMQEVCTVSAMWALWTVVAGLPYYCTDRNIQAFRLAQARLSDRSLPDIRRLDASVHLHQSDELQYVIVHSILMATVIDYSVREYGRERLPALLAKAGEHESWQTLAPAVYDVSFEEFEDGWRQYLADTDSTLVFGTFTDNHKKETP
jgi:hypothetical protein